MRNFILSFLAVVATAQVASAEPVVCGTEGTLAKRIKSCRDALGGDAERRVIAVPQAALDTPIAGLKDDVEYTWTLVSRLDGGGQIWLNTRMSLFYYDTPQSFSHPVTDEQLKSAQKECASFTMKLSRTKTIHFDLPRAATWKTVAERGGERLMGYSIKNPIVYGERGVLGAAGTPEDGSVIPVVCFGRN